MSAVVLCCNTLEDELQKVLAETGLNYPVYWLDAGQHNHPDRLRNHLIEVLSVVKADQALVAMGYCGGACVDLPVFDFELVFPRTDDCLSLLMGSMAKRQEASRQLPTYFLTAGWMRHTENLITTFDRDCEIFGPERAEHVYRLMLNHYKRFGFVETGAYDLESQTERIKPLANLLGIVNGRLKGDLTWLKRLLTGPWEGGDFLVVPSGERLSTARWNWSYKPNLQDG